MPVTDLLIEGSKLLVLGMGIVFSFLILLVGAMKVMSAAALKMSPEQPAPAKTPAVTNRAATDDDQNVVAAISAAITQFRNRRNG